MISPEAAEYLRSTPIVQWQQQKLQLSLDEVRAAAQAKGLRFEASESVNSDDYVLYTRDGTLVRRGTLSGIRFYIERR